MRLSRTESPTAPTGTTCLVSWLANIRYRASCIIEFISGGMQDFNYVFTNCFEITLELSCCKYPSKNELPSEWHKNKKSLLEYIKLTHIGIKGVVKDINGYPINNAEIYVQGVEDKPVRVTERGEFWRLLTPGTYNVRAIAFG